MICDNCGNVIINYNFYPIEKLKHDINSANQGESTILCKKCFESEQK